MQKTCSNCSVTLDDDALFCPSCSTAVSGSATVACPKCGKAITTGPKFCKYCAASLVESNRTVPTARVSAAPAVPPAKNEAEDKRSFITPAGAAIAAICFFLPWVEFSCDGQTRNTASGADMAHNDGFFWLIFAATLVILAAFFFFRTQRQILKARPIVILTTMVSLGILIYKYIEFSNGARIFGRTYTPEELGLSLRFGGIGTFLGFALAGIGSIFMKPASATIGPLEVGHREFDRVSGGIKPNVAALLCYAGLGLGILQIVGFIISITLLAIGPYKKSRLVRFHAFQSILWSFVSSCLGVIVFQVFRKHGENTALLVFVICVIFSGLFLMYKAYKNEAFKLPLIGLIATKLAARNLD